MPGGGPPMPGGGPPMMGGPPMGGPMMGGPGGGPPMPGMGGPSMMGGPPMMGGPMMGGPMGPPMMGMGALPGGGGPPKKKKMTKLPKVDWGKPKEGVEMKKLQIKKVQDKAIINGSKYWLGISEAKFDHPDEIHAIPEDFQEKFSRPKKAKKKKKGKKGGDSKDKKQEAEIVAMTFMESKRAQAVGMKLGALKLKNDRDFERMRQWVLKLSTASLASLRKDATRDNPQYTEIMGDLISNIIQSVPDENEQKDVEAQWDGKHYDHCARPDKYWIKMRMIPDVAMRATVWRFKVVAEKEIQYFKDYIGMLTDLHTKVRENESLQRFFGLIIRFGNYMNQKKRDRTRAFELNSIDSIVSCKSKDSQTLLGYIVGFCREHHEDLLNWVNELEFIHASSRDATASEDVQSELNQILGKVKQMRSFVGKNPEWGEKEFEEQEVDSLKQDDKFQEIMSEFMDDKLTETDELSSNMTKAIRDCEDLGKELFYKKDDSDPPNHHFGLLNDFRQKVQREKEHQIKQEEDAEKAAKREAKAKERNAKKKKKDKDGDMLDHLTKAEQKKRLKKKKRKPRGTVMGKKTGGAVEKARAPRRRKIKRKTRRNTLKKKTPGDREVEQNFD